MKKTFRITGINSAVSASVVEKNVRAISGVRDVSIKPSASTMRVSFNKEKTNEGEIIASVAQAGFVASVTGKDVRPQADRETGRMLSRLVISCILTAMILYLSLCSYASFPMWEPLSYALPGGIVQMLLLIPIAILNGDMFSGGVKAIRVRTTNMNSLIALGASAACVYSVVELIAGAWYLSMGQTAQPVLYFGTSSIIMTLVSLGKYFEVRERHRAREAVSRLSGICPKEARLVTQDGVRVVEADRVRAGDRIMVRMGDVIAADGVVESGNGVIDESMFTGESIPMKVNEGDSVTGAARCLSGEFVLRVQKPLPEMRLTQIISMVESAANTKAPIAKTADRMAAVFMPLALIVSIATLVLWIVFAHDYAMAVKSAMCVLVVSCPSALALAAHTAIMAGTHRGTEMGILIRNAAALQKLSNVDTVMFEKAGTLTAGEMHVSGYLLSEGGSTKSLIALAASACQSASYPYTAPILKEARRLGVPYDLAEEYEDVEGRGIRAAIGSKRVLVGDLAFMELNAQDVSRWRAYTEKLLDEGAISVYVASDGKVRGLIVLRDSLRPSSTHAVQMLTDMKVSTLMLTGDDKRTAQAIAAKAGVSEAHANLSTEDQDVMLRILQADGKKVMFVTDGKKGAPVLARAELGVIVGNGTDVAIESAEVVILRHDMRLVAGAVHLGKKTIRVIRQNLFWSFFYNIICLPIAAGALFPVFGIHFSPTMGAAAMCLSSICVVVNAMRLRSFHPIGTGKGENKLMRRILKRENAEDSEASADNETV
ncbi:MAG: heavy metal translocating P-type ATPase [Clostridia bacterium]|nr:heavy metal translocating P-type ATPase [Clostridia bacterium]